MRALKAIGSFIKNFMIIFSFIVNVVLLVVVIALVLFIFDIKNNIAQPLVNGLHSSFVGLDTATIDWTIPVRDTIPVVLTVPLETDTIVTLTEPVPLTVAAVINLPGVGVLNNAQVNLELPAGLNLPVRLDLDVPINEQLDIALDVRAVIPLGQTQLHDVANNLRLLFEPLARGLTNLPSDFAGVGPFISDVLDGSPPNLLADNAYSVNPWPGFSRTAGYNYFLFGEAVPVQNQPLETGIVQVGGIPALDEQLRPEVYTQGGPYDVNEQAADTLAAQNVLPEYYNGSINVIMEQQQALREQQTTQTTIDPATGGPVNTVPPGGDMGIIPTPPPGG